MDETLLLQISLAFFVAVAVLLGLLLYWFLCFGDKFINWTGLSSSELRRIPVFTHPGPGLQTGSNPGCPICLEEFGRGEGCRSMPECGHAFHEQCVDQWLVESRTCPTCRAIIIV